MGHWVTYTEYEQRQVPEQNALLAAAGHKRWVSVPVEKRRWVEDATPAWRPYGSSSPDDTYWALSAATRQKTFGAIAYSSRERRWGISRQYKMREDAEATAKWYCGGSDRAIMAWGNNYWLALAKGITVAAGWGLDQQSAERMALESAASRLDAAIILTSLYTGEGNELKSPIAGSAR